MERLKRLREEKNISQVRLSIEIGVAQETISAYERGKAVPTPENLKKLATFLNTSTDYLLELTDIKFPVNKISQSSLSEAELNLVLQYRNLSGSKKDRLQGYMDALRCLKKFILLHSYKKHKRK